MVIQNLYNKAKHTKIVDELVRHYEWYVERFSASSRLVVLDVDRTVVYVLGHSD